MLRYALVAVLVALLCTLSPWSARAGDGKSVEERLASLEKRLVAVEEVIRPLQEQVLPALLRARLAADETAAIASLRNLMSAQAQLQASALVDQDQDGTGEYGGFVEMSGGAAGRMEAVINPPILSSHFRAVKPDGALIRSGYCFRVFLPGKGGAPMGEAQGGFTKAMALDANLCEVAWCAYAWPEKQGDTGEHTFFVNQEGDIYATVDSKYSGPGSGPAADAAFQKAGRIDGGLAGGAPGADGNRWVVLR